MASWGKELSKDLIINYFKGSKTARGIAEIVKKSPTAIQKIIEKYKTLGSTENKPISGRPGTFTTLECRAC